MEQFTASEVVTKLRERFASGNDVPVPDVRLTRAEFDVIADRLETDDKAVPVAWRTFDGEGNYDYRDYENNEHYRDWYVSRNGAKYANWVEPLYSHPAPPDAERLAEALRVFDGSFLKELADLVSFPEDDRGCINRSFVMERVVGLRRCWDKLSATRAHSAHAQKGVE